MSYSSRFASKNASAARDWAAERQAKIDRAAQLREERRSGTIDQNCTFEPKKFTRGYTPPNAHAPPSEYSQEYLNNFHYGGHDQGDENERYDDRDMQRQYSKQSLKGSSSMESFGLNHAPTTTPNYSHPVQNYQQGGYGNPRHSVVNNAGHMIANSAAGKYAPQSGQIDYHQTVEQKDPRYDSLATEMRRHGTGNIPIGGDEYDMSYEFAASSSPFPAGQTAQYAQKQQMYSQHQHYGQSTTPQYAQQQPNYSQPAGQMHPQAYGMSYSESNTSILSNQQEELEGEHGEGSNRLMLLKSKLTNVETEGELGRNNSSAPASGSQGDLFEYAPTNSPPIHAAEGQRRNKPANARPRRGSPETLNEPPRPANPSSSGAISCTRQSGCQCSQCNADTAFQSALRSEPAKSRPRKKTELETRPPWNSDFTEDPVLDQDAPTNSPLPQVTQKPQKKRAAKPKPKPRPQWNSDITSEHETDQTFEDTPQPKAHSLDRMREELRGGKQDFIQQAHSGLSNDNSSNRPSNSRGSSRGSRGAPRGGQPSRGNTPQAEIHAPYRGMYRPDDLQQSPPQQQQQQQQRTNPYYQRNAVTSNTGCEPHIQSEAQPYQHQEQYQEQQQYPNTPSFGQDAPAIGNGGEVPEFAPPVPLQTCGTCSRKFNENAYAKHVKVCKKVFATKRKTFDTTKARLKGVAQNEDDMRTVKNALRNKNAPARTKKKANKWKSQSEALREAMKYSKVVSKAMAEGKDLSTLAPPPASKLDNDLIPCPHCGRTFNDKAAERHIPKCKDQKAKPNRLVRGGGTNASIRSKSKR